MIDNSKIEKKRVSILGCGWLGLHLAKRLIQDDISSQIKGSTTSESRVSVLESARVEAYVLPLTPGFTETPEIVSNFFDCDTLVVSIPPQIGRNGSEFYVDQVQEIVKAIKSSPVQEVLFISSTGVYPDLNRVVSEEDTISLEQSPAPHMVEAENLILSLRPTVTVSILRHAGLLGYNRIPGKYVQGLKNMTTGSIPVNYIHPDDAAQIMAQIIRTGVPNEIFNIVAPLHPMRSEVYDSTCKQFNWEAPTYSEPETTPGFKIISGEKLKSFYDHDFKYPDPLEFYYQLDPL